MEKLGADDLMPAFMYSLVKANVPYLYSELQFLNDFVVERNYSADEFNHYLMTRKRMSDLEAALHFINSIDMNVRDEKNALVPVTTMVDRVIDILHVGVAEFMQRKVVGSRRCCCRCIVLTHAPFIPSSGSFAFCLISLLYVRTGSSHTLDLRAFSQNQQPGPQIGRATVFPSTWSRSQLVSAVCSAFMPDCSSRQLCHRCFNAHCCASFAVPLFNR